jgi:hypothetical protein
VKYDEFRAIVSTENGLQCKAAVAQSSEGATTRAAPFVPLETTSALDERLPEFLDLLCGEGLGLEHLELRDPAEDAERGLEIGILEDAEVLPRAHHREEALDGTALVLDNLVDLV